MSYGYDKHRRQLIDELSLSPIIRREASTLLFQLRWAMREPRKAERATDTGFHAFFVELPDVLIRKAPGTDETL